VNSTAGIFASTVPFWTAGSAAPELRPEFRRIIERTQDKNEAFAETDKDRHHKRKRMIARESI
jgi:hypothetical protein